MREVCTINTVREWYSISQVLESREGTMTVAELIEYLQDNYNEDDPVVLSFDNGYTYGSISGYKLGYEEVEDDE